jgi:hypothetical protein
MTNHVLDRTIAEPLVTPNLRVRHLVEFGMAVLAGAVIFAVAIAISGGSEDTSAAVPADALRWEALVAREFPAAAPAAVAEAARWTALAEAYAEYAILPQGRIAEAGRLQGMADSFTRGQVAQAARLTALAASFTELPAPLQAAADRYQGLADSMR